MGCALKIQSILGKGFFKIERMFEKTFFMFILSILQHPRLCLLIRSTSCIHAVVLILSIFS